jgi:hypothetical protein
MSDNLPNKQTSADEIDLGMLFTKIRNGFVRMGNALVRGFTFLVLSIYIYIKTHFFWLAGLVVLASSLGLLLEYKDGSTHELNVMVKPSLDAKNYLYTTIEDIRNNIKAEDTAFFDALGMDISRMKGFDIEIISLKAGDVDNLSKELEYLAFLKESGIGELAEQLTNSIVQDRATQEQIITFYFNDPEIGADYAQKIMDYLNNNPFYERIEKVLITNAEARIVRNEELIAQVDGLIESYTASMVNQQPANAGSLVLDNKEPLNVPSLFSLKTELIRDTEAKRLELENRDGPVLVLSFGKPRIAELPVTSKKPVQLALIFVAMYLGVSLLKLLNRKAEEMLQKQ